MVLGISGFQYALLDGEEGYRRSKFELVLDGAESGVDRFFDVKNIVLYAAHDMLINGFDGLAETSVVKGGNLMDFGKGLSCCHEDAPGFDGDGSEVAVGFDAEIFHGLQEIVCFGVF